MKDGAYGLVEVLGSSNAVVCVDRMVKTSDVYFKTWNTRCGGHTTIFMAGDLSSVNAAVSAVAENPPCQVFYTAVISNPHEEMVKFVEEMAAKFPGN